VGCIECRNTGFKGRAGLYELLTVNDGLRTLITDSPDVRVLRDAAVRDGMRPLRIAGALKVAAGVTTIEEVLRNAPPTD
jgi:general secretion pathway protein E